MSYLWLKLIHIVSSTFLFGTGAGTAIFMLRSYLHVRSEGRSGTVLLAVIVGFVVQADWLFTATAGLIQLVTGLLLAWTLGLSFFSGWVFYGLLLFFFTMICWLPAAVLQVRMRDMAAQATLDGLDLPPEYHRYMRIWMALGLPAFSAMMGLFYLMIMKPG